MNKKKELIREYLQGVNLHSLDKTKLNDLERDIYQTELWEMLRSMKGGKAPGPDGFTLIYYKTFWVL